MVDQREAPITKIEQQTMKSAGSEKKPLLFKIGEPTFVPKYESSIPRAVTSGILQREQLPKEMSALGSSVIEDFIIGKIKQGIASPERIADAFVTEDIEGKVRQYIETVKTRSQEVVWDKIFTMTDAKKVQAKVCREMEVMDMTPEQVSVIAGMKVDIDEGIGGSSTTPDGVYVSRLQAVRKAMDYGNVFGDAIPFEQVLKALMSSTIGHELGHKIDEVVGYAINNIPMDQAWKKDGVSHENKGERFAEFWGSVFDDQSFQIKQRQWLVDLTKVTQMWDTIENYNSSHEDKADLMGIFRSLDEKLEGKSDISALLTARRLLYGRNEVENYASPYTREVVAAAVKPKKLHHN